MLHDRLMPISLEGLMTDGTIGITTIVVTPAASTITTASLAAAMTTTKTYETDIATIANRILGS